MPRRKKNKRGEAEDEDDDDDDDDNGEWEEGKKKKGKKGKKEESKKKGKKKMEMEVVEEEKGDEDVEMVDAPPPSPPPGDVEMSELPERERVRRERRSEALADDLRRQAIENDWREKKRELAERNISLPTDVEMMSVDPVLPPEPPVVPDPPVVPEPLPKFGRAKRKASDDLQPSSGPSQPPPPPPPPPPSAAAAIAVSDRRRAVAKRRAGTELQPTPKRDRLEMSRKRKPSDELRSEEKRAMNLLVQQRLDELQGGKKTYNVPTKTTVDDVDRRIVHEMRDVYKDAIARQAGRQGLRGMKRPADPLERLLERGGLKRDFGDDDDDDDSMDGKHPSLLVPGLYEGEADESMDARDTSLLEPDLYEDEADEEMLLASMDLPTRRSLKRGRGEGRGRPASRRPRTEGRGSKRDREEEEEEKPASRRLKTSGLKRGWNEDEWFYPTGKRKNLGRGQKKRMLSDTSDEDGYVDGLWKRRPKRKTVAKKIVRRPLSPLAESKPVKRRQPFSDLTRELEEELTGVPYKTSIARYALGDSDDDEEGESSEEE